MNCTATYKIHGFSGDFTTEFENFVEAEEFYSGNYEVIVENTFICHSNDGMHYYAPQIFFLM